VTTNSQATLTLLGVARRWCSTQSTIQASPWSFFVPRRQLTCDSGNFRSLDGSDEASGVAVVTTTSVATSILVGVRAVGGHLFVDVAADHGVAGPTTSTVWARARVACSAETGSPVE